MGKLREKTATVLSCIYGSGIAIALFAGAISFLGYVVAIIIGGDMAEQICHFIYNRFYPVIIYCSSFAVIVGLIKMYVAGEKSLVPPSKKKK